MRALSIIADTTLVVPSGTLGSRLLHFVSTCLSETRRRWPTRRIKIQSDAPKYVIM